MTKRRVVVHYMHEHEARAASAAIPGAEVTQGFLVGEAEDAAIAALRNAGLVVHELVDREPETPGRAPQASLISEPPPRAAPAPAPAAIGAMPAAAAAPGEATGEVPGYFVLQLAGPLVPAWRAALEKLGIALGERFPGHAYSVRLDHAALRDDAVKLPFVRGVRPYGADDTGPIQAIKAPRPSPPVAPGAPGVAAAAPAAEPLPAAIYDVLLHRSDDLKTVQAWAASHAVEVVAARGRKLRVRASVMQARALAALSPVALIEAWTPPRLFNDAARRIVRAEKADATPLPFTGKGEIIGVADTGIDQGHAAFEGRLLPPIARGRPNDPSDPHGHGTHVAATAAGSGAGGPGATYRGIAPDATVLVQSVMDADGGLSGLPFSLGDLFAEAYGRGARIHNDSWGAELRSTYAMTSLEVDEFVWNHKDMLVVIAAGNAGSCAVAPDEIVHAAPGFPEWSSIGAPATSKNAIVVGAGRSDRQAGGYAALTYGEVWPDDFGVPPTSNERVSGNANDVAAFSSRGPCNDHRVKPDLVAPGTDVLSARASTAPTSHFGGLDAATGGRYGYMCGTSMAAPVVAGAAALVREYLRTQRNHASPSAALVKAILINGTRRLSGAAALADHPFTPNFHQGFGCLDLGVSIPIEGTFVLAFDDDWGPNAGFVESGQRRRFRFKTNAPATLRLTLAYSDAPGRGLQNDLSVFLEGPGPKRWVGNENVPLALQWPDPDNNVEVIRIDAAPAGDYLVQVTATNVLRAPQDFALVVSGALAQSVLQPVP